MTNKTPITFISAERSELSTSQNSTRTEELRYALEALNLQYQEVSGVYQGDSEDSFLVLTPGGTSGETWRELITLAKWFKQESILHVGSDRYGSLYYTDSGKWEGLGKFKELPKYQAAARTSYSIINNKYYDCGY